jgi:hypothetical protein
MAMSPPWFAALRWKALSCAGARALPIRVPAYSRAAYPRDVAESPQQRALAIAPGRRSTEFLWNAERAHIDLVRGFEQFARRAILRLHVPFTLS